MLVEGLFEEGGGRNDLEVVIDGDGAVGGEGDAERLETETLGAGLAAGGHQDHVGLDALQLPFLVLEAHLTIRDLLHGALHVEGDALAHHLLPQALGDVAVKSGKALLEILYHCHLRTKAVEHRGKLHADDACPDDDEFLRKGLKCQQSCGIHDTRAGPGTLDGEPFRLGTRGDNDIGRGRREEGE